jgi:hypothetical protein
VHVLLLAHEGHQHGPDLGLVALLVAGAVLVTLLLVRLLRDRVTMRGPTSGRPDGHLPERRHRPGRRISS